MPESILVEQQDVVANVILNRPKSHNALTPEMIGALRKTFEQLAGSDAIRVIVLRGRGRSFCAGADLRGMRAAAEATFEDNVAGAEAIFDLMDTIYRCPKPTVAAIQGAAIGGGAGLASCCDIGIAVADTVFAFSETRLGIVPAVISPFVTAKMDAGAVRELFLTGERFTAQRAQRAGLVQHLADDEAKLDAMLQERVQQLLQAAPGAQAQVKNLLREIGRQPQSQLRDYTSGLIARRRASDEGREGMSAFLEKRAPWWQR